VSNWFRSYGFAEVHPHLILGAYPLDQSDVRMLSTMGITRVLNLTEDREYDRGQRKQLTKAFEAADIDELRLPTPDYGNLPPQLLDSATTQLNAWLDAGDRVYLHCRAGWQRSATVAAAVVAEREQLDPEQAMARVKTRKPSADPLPHQRDDLLAWWELQPR